MKVIKMEPQERSVHNNLKKILVVIILLFGSVITNAQTIDDSVKVDIAKSIGKKIIYPAELKSNCVITLTKILFRVNPKGEIDGISMADNAPLKLRGEFNRVKDRINLEQLKKMISKKGLSNCGILIPLYYVFQKDGCGNILNVQELDTPNQYSFNGIHLDLLTYNLEPMVFILYPTVR